MKVFVTGAGGFIGSNVVKVLVASGHEVAILRRPESNLLRLSGLEVIPIYVEHPDLSFSAVEQETLNSFAPNVVVHLGWNGVGNLARNSAVQLENIQMALSVLQAASKAGVKHFVGIGSQAEYGPCEGVIDEQQALNPTTLYGAAKAAVGLFSSVIAAQSGMEFSWIRVFSTYGAGDEPYWMIQDVAMKLLNNEAPALTLGSQLWDYLHVQDAAKAICAVSESESGLGQLNLGSGVTNSIREIVETLRDIINPDLVLNFGAVGYRSDQVMHLEANISKIKSATGWAPTVSLEDGLTETVEFLRRNK